MQDERDIVVFTDDQGNDLELEVMDYFYYNGQEYAVLSDAGEESEGCTHEGCACGNVKDKCDDKDCACGKDGGDCEDEDCECGKDVGECEDEDCECGCDDDQEVYIMKIVQMDDDMEEFVPVEDQALMQSLIAIVQRRFDGEEVGDDPEETV